jgi:2,3-bisphosphoglycerate-independent phosphoglycerate mutase
MDAVAQAGIIGRADNVPASMSPGSDVGTMSLFGYDPLTDHTGRAPIEAAAQKIELGPGDWAVRCNLVTVEQNVMKSFTAGQIPSKLGAKLIALLNEKQGHDNHWQFHAGVSYRNLLIYRAKGTPGPFSEQTQTTPPHDIIDQRIDDDLPQGPGSDILRQLMENSIAIFAQSAANRDRKNHGELPATQIWLWGEGHAPALEPFVERFGITGAVITAVDLLRGMGLLLGWQIIEVPGATGYTDTDYAAKAEYAIETLKNVDLVVVHVEATDEASHEGDAQAKVAALEKIDREIVGPLHQFLESQGDYRILVSPDHPTFLRTKTHAHGYVPFTMCGHGVNPDGLNDYDEATATKSELVLKGHELMPMFVQGRG